MTIRSNGRTKGGIFGLGKTFCCVLLAALAVFSAGTAWADQHPTGVPALNSRPGAPYTIFLDFDGFNYPGNWGGTGLAPGAQPAYDNVAPTGSFNATEQANMTKIWAWASEKYAPFNINVTSVDPAVAAGQAGTDALRLAYYDNTPKMMHTMIGDEANNWYGPWGGVSYVGVTASAQPGSNGYHTNWIFTSGLPTYIQFIGEASAHENGHGLALWHQSDYNGSTLVSEYSQNSQGVATGPGVRGPHHGRLLLLSARHLASWRFPPRRQSHAE